MVVALKPGRFYGKSLPRPHIYTDIKFSSQRVDPPPSINDALIRWAGDAHWSMGGLSFKRSRMQGKIEGRIDRIRAEAEHDMGKAGASPQKDQKRSPRRTKKTFGFEAQAISYTKSRSPIDRLFLADEEARQAAKNLSPKVKSADRLKHRISKSGKLQGEASKDAKVPAKRPVKRALLVEDDTDSDDGLEDFLNEIGRPLRRSGRLRHTELGIGDTATEEHISSHEDENRSVQRKQQLDQKKPVATKKAKSLRRSSRVMKSPAKS
ncbi:hypothetical protein O6H91_11G045700 [Diphasiastrum complanatum]|uniref:Uncharacterized protein n=1 Tax=Diphasiastrum complanatum TaxID=34168 RepID=A0ACC2C8M5_DIPCM|nr:hypothetical protein O6H91_11G045700 [Diphasiastrum complanatum]